jgi:hypothetical protein
MTAKHHFWLFIGLATIMVTAAVFLYRTFPQ